MSEIPGLSKPSLGKDPFMYLSVLEMAMVIVYISEENSRQVHINFASHVLIDLNSIT